MKDFHASKIRFPDALTTDEFLRTIWQRQPLFMPSALVNYRCPLSPEELAGLACEDDVESRLIVEQPRGTWQLRHGPFSDSDFTALPDKDWTLLVQDVDKYLPHVATLLLDFRFIPQWRVDDIMISYAATGGSVGPHIDQYDVFLVQALGQRRWRINTSMSNNPSLCDDSPLKILAKFKTDQEWIAAPGDVLYLPPGVAHWGIAETPCMTCSVGFRAPLWRELLADWCDQLIQQVPDSAHYRDPSIATAALGSAVPEAVFALVEQKLNALQHVESKTLRSWFGRFVSQAKPPFIPTVPTRSLSAPAFHEQFRQCNTLHRHPGIRLLVAQVTDGSWSLFAGGREFAVPENCLQILGQLTEATELSFDALGDWLCREACLELLTQLYNLGYLEIPTDP